MKLHKRVILTVILAITTVVVLAVEISLTPKSGLAKATNAVITIAVMGDSNADEYHADDNRGGQYEATTLNWVELLAKYRDINFGKYADWGGFRRTGYEYNFSRSGATTDSGLEEGVDKSIAALVDAGKVQFVFYALGSNDFAWYYDIFSKIYEGQLSGADLDAYVQKRITNVTTALDTINASHKAKILVSLIPDVTLSPFARVKFPDPDKLKQVTDAIAKANDGVRSAVAERGYTLFDVNAVAMGMITAINAQGNIVVGGEEIVFTASGDEPHHVLLSDNVHSGTVFSGMYANEWVSAANTAFGTQIQPFSPDELLVYAGIKSASVLPPQPSQDQSTGTAQPLLTLFTTETP